jgi:hypothetical protein
LSGQRFQREVPLSKSPIVVAKERRGGAFGQAGKFRSLFPNSICSAQWIRHPSSYIQPSPNRPRGPTEWAIPHFPPHVLTQRLRAGVGKSGGDRDSSSAVVCRTQALREYSRGGHHRHGNARSLRRFALPKETLPAATTVTRLLRLRLTALSAMLSPSNHEPSGPRLSARPKSCKTAIP